VGALSTPSKGPWQREHDSKAPTNSIRPIKNTSDSVRCVKAECPPPSLRCPSPWPYGKDPCYEHNSEARATNPRLKRKFHPVVGPSFRCTCTCGGFSDCFWNRSCQSWGNSWKRAKMTITETRITTVWLTFQLSCKTEIFKNEFCNLDICAICILYNFSPPLYIGCALSIHTFHDPNLLCTFWMFEAESTLSVLWPI